MTVRRYGVTVARAVAAGGVRVAGAAQDDVTATDVNVVKGSV